MTREAAAAPWWRDAVIYQVYIRSFADGNGDGLGDIAGLRSRLRYLAALGVDALWITPWYRSPMADAGYDVEDYRDIDPRLGTLSEAEEFLAAAHEHGLRVIPDIVPNHTSDQHPWFRAALAAGPGSAERGRYHFRQGRGPDGGLPPNNWQSRFGGPAWTRVREPDGRPGQWYLHLFAPEQPDLNWENPEVRDEFHSILRFWFDRGVDGFRIDVAAGMIKHPDLADMPAGREDAPAGDHPFQDRDEVHEIYRGWRRVAQEYSGDRAFVAEAWVRPPDRLARYLLPDGLHTAFNFDFLECPWDARRFRDVIDSTMGALDRVGAPATWVLSNHDVVRHVTRYGRVHTGHDHDDRRQNQGWAADLELGTRRARAAALLCLALPGGAYLYQGEELGLWEVEDIPEDRLQDPIWERSGHTARGRDGCRVPLPWSGLKPPFGFSPPDCDAEPWLPQPEAFRDVTVERQDGDASTMLELYRAALRLRRTHPALGAGSLRWLDAPEGVLAFERDPGFACVVNLAGQPFSLPRHENLLLTSGSVDGNVLLPDTAAWLEL
jgi:alpha-glucosidase